VGDIGGTCSTRRGDKKFSTVFWSEDLKRRDHSYDLGLDGRITFRTDLKRNGVGRCGLDSPG
jgi:hypothetical protein